MTVERFNRAEGAGREADDDAFQPAVAHDQVGPDADNRDRTVVSPEERGEVVGVRRREQHLSRTADAEPCEARHFTPGLIPAGNSRESIDQHRVSLFRKKTIASAPNPPIETAAPKTKLAPTSKVRTTKLSFAASPTKGATETVAKAVTKMRMNTQPATAYLIPWRR